MSFLHEYSYDQVEFVNFSELENKTLVDIIVFKDKQDTNDEIHFVTKEGETYIWGHSQECCESVTIEDICGDLKNLLNAPLLRAQEVGNENKNDDWDSNTWTFYKLATVNGWVDIRWYGISNGYYSEVAHLFKVKN